MREAQLAWDLDPISKVVVVSGPEKLFFCLPSLHSRKENFNGFEIQTTIKMSGNEREWTDF